MRRVSTKSDAPDYEQERKREGQSCLSVLVSQVLPVRLIPSPRPRAGSVKALPERFIGYAPLNNIYIGVIFDTVLLMLQ